MKESTQFCVCPLESHSANSVVQCSVVVYHECVWHAHLLNRVNFGSVRESIMRVCVHTCNNGMFEQYRVCQLS